MQASGLEWTILRLAEVYGISSKRGIDALINYIERWPIIPVIGDGRYRVCPVHISDVVYAIEKVIEDADKTTVNKIYTIAGPEDLTYNEVIYKISHIKRLNRKRVYISPAVFNALVTPVSFLIKKNSFPVKDQLQRLICEKSADISLAEKDLSFRPKRMEDAVNKV